MYLSAEFGVGLLKVEQGESFLDVLTSEEGQQKYNSDANMIFV